MYFILKLLALSAACRPETAEWVAMMVLRETGSLRVGGFDEVVKSCSEEGIGLIFS